MAQLRSDLLIRLTDRASGPARGILGLMNRLRTVGAGAGGGMAALGDRATRSIGGLHVKLLAATAAAYGLQRAMGGVVKPAASFETKLLDIAQKADLSDSGMAALSDRIRNLAKDVGRGANDVAQGVDVLLGMGLDQKSSMGIMPAIAKAASAYNAEVDDLAKAGMSAIDTLGVKVADFSRSLDGMARSGKEGAFEFKEMARYFPSLAAMGKTLKLDGVEGVNEIAAALQIIRKGSGSSEEAATRLSDVFGKLTSSETVKKFQKLGIKDISKDLSKAQAAAAKAGKPFSVIDFVVANLNKALKGDVGRIGEIFQDKEAKLGAIALMQWHSEFQRIRKSSRDASGEIERDFARRMKTYDGQVRRFSGAFEDLKIAAGNRFLGPLTATMEKLSDLLNTLDSRVNVFDRVGNAIRGLVTGILGPGSDGGITQAFGKLSELIFGNTDTLSEDVDKLGQSFERFRQMGASLREFAEAIGGFVARFNELTGLDFGALAGWAATLGGAALGVSLFAKAVRGLASAIALLTGMKALWSLGKGIGSLLPKGLPQGAKPSAPAQPASRTQTSAPAAKPAATPPANHSSATPGGRGSVPTVTPGRGFVSAPKPVSFGPFGMADIQRRFAEMTKVEAPASALSKLALRLKGGLLGFATDTVGKTLIESLFDTVDRGLKLDTSNRPDPGFLPTLQRLWDSKATAGANVDPGAYERSRRVDDEFRRDPEAARGRAMMRQGGDDQARRDPEPSRGQSGGDGEQRVKLATSDLAALLQPKGTQDVRVTNPPPAPNVHVSVIVNATTNANPGQIGAEVGKAVGAQTKRAIEGAFSDAAN